MAVSAAIGIASSIGLFASAAQATEYYTTTVGTVPVLATTVFEYTSDNTGDVFDKHGENTNCAGDWCSISGGGTFGSITDPYAISGTTSFNDFGDVGDPTKGFMLGVSDPSAMFAFTTGPGVPNPNIGLAATGAVTISSDLHLVMAVSNSFASYAVSSGESVEELFGYRESSIIDDVLVYNAYFTAADPNIEEYYYGALGGLQQFAGNVGNQVGYALPDATYTLLSFSNGVLDGTGSVSEVAPTVSSPSAAPEPASWALMIFGVAGAGAALRFGKRRGRAIAAA